MPLTVAIVGRPNVGKSTLFNRLVGRRQALVDPTPGVTRDRIEGQGRIGPLGFTAIDTAGLAEGSEASIEGRLRQQTGAALEEADLALMLIDAKSGLTALDGHFAAWLRRQDRPVILVANKCEGAAAESFASEAWSLGLGPPIPISAQNGEGLAGLAEAIEQGMAAKEAAGAPAEAGDRAAEVEERPLRLVVAGRPNVGKSSLINRLVGRRQALVDPTPGVTRDRIEGRGRIGPLAFAAIDTAGLADGPEESLEGACGSRPGPRSRKPTSR